MSGLHVCKKRASSLLGSFNHDRMAILNVEATDRLLDAASLQIVDGVCGWRVANGTDAIGLTKDVFDTGGCINFTVAPLERVAGNEFVSARGLTKQRLDVVESHVGLGL